MKRKIQAFAALVCLLVAGLAYGQSDVLKGLRSLKVLVDLQVGDINLTESDILRDVSLKLELAGIKVDTGTLSTPPPGMLPLPFLYVSAVGFDSGLGRWVVTFRIELLAAVITTLDWQESSTIAIAKLWSTRGRLLSGPKSDMARRVRDVIKDQMDRFLLDYVRANRAEAE